MSNVGRPKINCIMGDKKRHCVNCYDYEWQQIKIYFAKLKAQRPKYYHE